MSSEPKIQKVMRLSQVYKMAREEFENMKNEPTLDSKFFTDNELKHYVNFLLREHKEEWLVINDLSDGNR